MRKAIVCTALVLAAWDARADQWPEFRGPTGQGHADEHGLPLEWSESRHVRWKVPVPGSGWSSPVVSDGRVWVTTAVETGTGKGDRAASRCARWPSISRPGARS